MTLYQFNQLDEMEQAEAVWDSEFIADRKEGQYKILLYQRDSFYIEAYYNSEHNVLVRFRSFSNTDQLEPYLDQINIVNLISKSGKP